MAFHTEYPLRGPCIPKILNFLLTISTSEASGAKRLVARKNSQILNFVTTGTTAIRAIIADERTVTEKEEVCIRVEESATGITAETVDMPSIAS